MASRPLTFAFETMAGILSSWWSGKPPEDAEKGEEEEKEKEGDSKPVDWAAGLESKSSCDNGMMS